MIQNHISVILHHIDQWKRSNNVQRVLWVPSLSNVQMSLVLHASHVIRPNCPNACPMGSGFRVQSVIPSECCDTEVQGWVKMNGIGDLFWHMVS